MAEYIPVQEYADMKGVSERTVYRWVKNGDVDVRELDGKTHIRFENDDGNSANKDTLIADLTTENRHLMSENDHLKSENQHLQGEVEYLRTQLSQSLASIDEHRQRSDTIIAQLTTQSADQTKLLEYHQRPFWRRWLNRS